jgi:putative transposase
MPEHVHLLIYPEHEDYSISAILLMIKQSSSRRILIFTRKHDPGRLDLFRTGQKTKKYRFWQDGGGYDRNITDRRTLLKVIDYVPNNPVRKGLVNSPSAWKWSSYRDWQYNTKGLIPIQIDRIPMI